MAIGMGPNVVNRSRNGYTFIGLISDLGGLNDGLILLAQFWLFLINIFRTNDLAVYLVTSIFKKVPSTFTNQNEGPDTKAKEKLQ